MSLRIAPYEASDIVDVKEFNRRLEEGNAGFQFPEHVESRDLPKREGRNIFQEYFIARDGQNVRGGYILKTQPCSLRGQMISIGNYQLPLSEGIVNRAYGMVGLQILFDALKKQPKLYSLGMGGIDRPLPQMLKKMGWHVSLVPFLFRVRNPQAFLRQTVFLRANAKLKIAADFFLYSGVGWVMAQVWNGLTSARNIFTPLTTRAEVVSDFSEWADQVWENARADYDWVGGRDSATLNILYPKQDARFIRLKITDSGNAVGWVLVMATRMKNHKQFGGMYVGSIVDGMCKPSSAYEVLRHATAHLNGLGVDIMISNQSHRRWIQGLEKLGFFSGPSNYGFACSPAFSGQIGTLGTCHLNRGDGDGPINL